MPEFQFNSVSDFFAMGGDAFFVWVSYLVFFVFVAWCVLVPKWQRNKVIRLIRARRQREETMQGRNAGQESGNPEQNPRKARTETGESNA